MHIGKKGWCPLVTSDDFWRGQRPKISLEESRNALHDKIRFNKFHPANVSNRVDFAH